jgi:membrane fusion protein (multidrug efflux system)
LIYTYKGGKAQSTEITTGIRDSADIQILTGVNTGDTILTTGLMFLRPGIDVKLTKIN